MSNETPTKSEYSQLISKIENLYTNNLWHLRAVFLLSICLILIGLFFLVIELIILFINGFILNLNFFGMSPKLSWALIIVGGIGFFFEVFGLILLIIYKSSLKEIPKYLYSIERLNLIKISLEMIESISEQNSDSENKEETKKSTVDKLFDIIKKMDGTGLNVF